MPDENFNAAQTRELHFSINGDFITDLAREKFYEDHKLSYALELLTSCLQSDQLKPHEPMGLAIGILDGRYAITGTYPGPDYKLVEIPEEQRNPDRTIKAYEEKLLKKLEKATKREQQLMQRLCFILDYLQEHLGPYTIDNMSREYAREFGHPLLGAGTTPQNNMPTTSLLESYMTRMHSDCDEPDYGWLFPDGTFYPVDFGEHQGWAWEYIKSHTTKDKFRQMITNGELATDRASDILANKYRAILMHNPAMGVARPQINELQRITKAQREFLFEYYTKRGLDDLAFKYYDEE